MNKVMFLLGMLRHPRNTMKIISESPKPAYGIVIGILGTVAYPIIRLFLNLFTGAAVGLTTLIETVLCIVSVPIYFLLVYWIAKRQGGVGSKTGFISALGCTGFTSTLALVFLIPLFLVPNQTELMANASFLIILMISSLAVTLFAVIDFILSIEAVSLTLNVSRMKSFGAISIASIPLVVVIFGVTLWTSPAVTKSYYSLQGTRQLKAGNYERAVELYDKSTSTNSSSKATNTLDHVTWAAKGAALEKLQKWDAASQAYTKAIEVDDKDAKIFNARGLMYVQLNQYDAALKDFKQAIELDTNQKAAWFNMAYVLNKQGNVEEAKKALKKVLEIDPNQENAKKSLENLEKGQPDSSQPNKGS